MQENQMDWNKKVVSIQNNCFHAFYFKFVATEQLRTEVVHGQWLNYIERGVYLGYLYKCTISLKITS